MGTISNEEWANIKRKCCLDDEEIWMAKQMQLTPKKIFLMVRDKREAWKDVVPLRIRRLYDLKFKRRSELQKLKED